MNYDVLTHDLPVTVDVFQKVKPSLWLNRIYREKEANAKRAIVSFPRLEPLAKKSPLKLH
jgi:hypothetical protein